VHEIELPTSFAKQKPTETNKSKQKQKTKNKKQKTNLKRQDWVAVRKRFLFSFVENERVRSNLLALFAKQANKRAENQTDLNNDQDWVARSRRFAPLLKVSE